MTCCFAAVSFLRVGNEWLSRSIVTRSILQLFLPASVLELLRNALELIFTTLLRRLWRRRPVSRFQWIGVLFACGGTALVSGGQLSSDGGANQSAGLLLLLFRTFFAACQDTSEEVLTTHCTLLDGVAGVASR